MGASARSQIGVTLLTGWRGWAKTNVTIANTVTETSIFASAANSINSAIWAKVPANDLQTGDKIRITARGVISTLGSSPGTLTCKFKKDSTAVATGTSPTLPTSLASALLEIDIVCEVTGAGTVDIAGFMAITDPATGTVFKMPIIATGATLVTTAEWTLDTTLTWSVADAGNTLAITMSEVHFLNVE